MSATTLGFLSTRHRKREVYEQDGQDSHCNFDGNKRTSRKKIIFSSKSYVAAGLTLVITISIIQVFLFHYYIGFNSRISDGSQTFAFEDWHCFYPGLDDIHELAQKFGVDLVVVDPDLINLLERRRTNSEDRLNDANRSLALTFSEPSKRNQESTHKTIVHLAAINETSGGQPNLKLFYNALKNNGYTTLKYVDSSQSMQPEVYRRASHLFDDMPLEGIREHKYSHDTSLLHSSIDEPSKYNLDPHDGDEVSKIYTEFITHIFILNRTEPIEVPKNDQSFCNNDRHDEARFTVIHVLVLYNYDYNPTEKWIQPGLVMDEIDKHKLLKFNVHSFDFRIPVEQYYIHEKRQVLSVTRPPKVNRRKRSLESIRILEPNKNSQLNYINNSYLHCKASQFDIRGLRDNQKRVSNYLLSLDNSKPISIRESRRFIINQLITAFQFMDTFSSTYGNFSYWITGSTLLAYYKHCDLAIQPISDSMLSDNNKPEDVIWNLEFGLFSAEVNTNILEDLAGARNIGIVMMSDWLKAEALISFYFRECPNIIINLYLYELKKDFYQYYFITRNSMTMNHKFTKRLKSKNYLSNFNVGHHVFNTDNLNLCWTNIEKFKPFRVPCNVYDHLRRIYVI